MTSEEEWNLSQIKQRPSRFQPKRIGGVIRKLMSQKGYGQTQVAESLEQAWREAVGKELAATTRPGNVSRGVLHCHAADSAVCMELEFVKQGVLRELKSKLPELNIRDLKVKVSNLN